MRIPKKRAEIILIILFLFMAIFNDVIRLPDTVISAYRLTLPVVLCMALVDFRSTWKFFIFGSGMIFLLIIQNIVFCNVFGFETTIDILWQIRYLFYYFSIVAIFVLIRILRKKDRILFQKVFYKGIPIICMICLIIYIGLSTAVFDRKHFANPNNYGACLASVFPWFLTEYFFGKKSNIIWCIAIIVSLLLGDSKAALAGVAIQIAIIVSIVLVKKTKEGNKILVFMIPVVITGFLAIVLSPIKINGYSVKEMFMGMVSHIVKGETYYRNNSSLAWRTNAIVHMLNGIKDSYFLGIGIGNTGKLLRHLMPDIVAEQRFASTVISPHCAWLEFFCDCGIWAIGLCAYVYMVAIRKLFHAKRLDKIGIFFVAFVLSFPLWVMSPSGIYTTYLIFIIIAWLYEWSKIKC